MSQLVGSPLKLEVKRSRLMICWDRCVICQKYVEEKLTSCSEKGKGTLFHAVNVRQDDVYRRLYEEVSSLDEISVDRIRYHKSCYRSYTSKVNLARYHPENAVADEGKQNFVSSQHARTRSYCSIPIEWSVCVFCKKQSYKKDRKLKKVESKERVDSLLEAARKKLDFDMEHILSNAGFIDKALYHSSCITNYLLKKEKAAVESKDDNEHDVAFQHLISTIHDDLIIRKKAFSMNMLLERFCMFLSPELASKYTSQKLQRRIENYYGDQIVIQTDNGQGKTNMLFSSSITVAEAIKAARHLKEELRMTELESSFVDAQDLEEDQILHKAALILRSKLNEVNLTDDYFPSPCEISLKESLKSIPASLVDFLSGILSDQFLHKEHQFSDLSLEKKRKCVAIAECLLSLCKRRSTPFTLGLALQLHHDYGSKQLIDTINAHGFCASYSEVRTFLTSAANHEIEKNRDGSYVPSGIIPLQSGGAFIQEGADNVDLNAETIDGKNTFHSMARAVFQIRTVSENGESDLPSYNEKVQRGLQRSLVLDEDSSKMLDCLPFQKPKERCGPRRYTGAFEQVQSCGKNAINGPDVPWVLLRMFSRGFVQEIPITVPIAKQIIPFWTGFNKHFSEQSKSYAFVSYAPVIDAKPSDMATVYTAMIKCLEMSKRMGQNKSVQTFDQQLYAVAKQVKWAMPDTFTDHELRLGGFHTLSCFMSAIGKIWTSAGLRDLLVDSGVYAGCTVDQMLQGKQFNRAVRGFTLVYEVLMATFLESFLVWCKTEDRLHQVCSTFWDSLVDVHYSWSTSTKVDKIKDYIQLFFRDLGPLIHEFCEYGCQISPTFKFWEMFLRAVEVILANIRAERSGDWNLHLQSVFSMLPYFFVANKTNYARWTPAYLLDMLSLPEEVKYAFMSGSFAIRQISGKFNGIWSDMATEKTVIKDSKGNGGIVGLTRQKSALLRWTITRHILGQFASEMKKRSGINTENDVDHEENRPTAMTRDEEHASTLIDHIKTSMTNPFDLDHPPKSLVNISTGLVATKEVQQSLVKCLDQGNQMVKTFVDGSFDDNGCRDFYAPISRSSLKTFEDMNKACNLKCRSGEMIKAHINPELVFRRALSLSTLREDVTIEKVLAFPIGPIPTALFHDDGSMRKCCKSDFIHALENDVCSAFSLRQWSSNSSVLIRDGMVVVQSFDVKRLDTFADLARHYFSSAISNFSGGLYSCLVDVFDRYDTTESTKSAERLRRSSCGGQKVYNITESTKIPEWRKFLGSSKNKQNLIKYLGDYALNHFHEFGFQNEQEFILAGAFGNPEIVKVFRSGSVADVVDLFSTQEEADTRIILHSIFADRNFTQNGEPGRIVVKSPDTDVLLLCISFFHQFQSTSEMWFQTGSISSVKDGRRFIPVHDLCESLGPVLCHILPAAHALTGCDTTSSLFGIGKKSVLKALKSNSARYETLRNLSNTDSEVVVDAGRILIADLYDSKGKNSPTHSDLNKLRVKLASTKDVSLVRLPPSEAAFKQHMLRVSLQTYTWMSSGVSKPPPRSPLEYGWQRLNGILQPVFFEGQMTSDFLKDLICTCRGKNVCSQSCVCFEQNLGCTSVCVCQGNEDCKNANTLRADSVESDE